ncbi:urease accessory protein UreE [uncultured Cohaesibacter sp.]|uniref:urease accessory protein UreE n=1 Tax=uncultured Cohaesibacter sp. TaxID=1002546 RepID=UPI0029312C04|nr:urease accessory protein UreE [uncultured Cohaesibacter sp.]
MIKATSLTHSHDAPTGVVTLTYEERYRRRIAMKSDEGLEFLLDLPKVTELQNGDDILLEDGRRIRVRAADEPLMKATASDAHHLTRMAWHVGNRHLTCEIHPDHLLLRHDHVIKDMLIHLGAEIEELEGPFNPEGGAYGQGRTHSHEH